MDFHQLKCFREVAITQNCSQAAANLGMSRSRLRFLIKELEESLSIRLFEPDSRTDMSTRTEYGKRLLKYANQLYDLEIAAKAVGSSDSPPEEREVRIYYNENLLHTFLPTIYKSLSEYPFLGGHPIQVQDVPFSG